MPLFSELDALGHAEASRKLYFQASRIMVGIILPLVVGIVMLGPAFLEHWMGVEYAREGRYVLYIIALAYGIQWLNPLANRMLTGYGQHGIMAKIGIISSFFNLAFSLLLVQFVGKEGVALGTLLPVLFFEPLYLYKVCKILETGLWGYARQVLMPLLLPVFSIMAGIAFLCRLHAPESLPQVIGIGVGGMLLYLPTFWLFGLRNDERNMLLQKIGLQKVMTG
jgi:O-antigen/teichoic acid export membrane protein